MIEETHYKCSAGLDRAFKKCHAPLRMRFKFQRFYWDFMRQSIAKLRIIKSTENVNFFQIISQIYSI